MAQLTVYIDEQTIKKIERAARIERISISRWVKQKLAAGLSGSWPPGYWDIFGALAKSDLKRPEQPRPARDIKRQSL